MSLILEALRRSEAERRRGQMPDLLAPEHVVRRRERSGWVVPMVALVVGMVLAAAVARWWWASPAVVLAPTAQPVPVPVPVPATIAPVEAAAPLPRPQIVTSPAQAAPSSAPAPILAPETFAPISAGEEPVAEIAIALPNVADTFRTEVAMLGQNERAALPPLRISMHVFDEDPSRRFAIVDGQRLREGDVVAPGLRLQTIERDGLQLEWQGRALWLPR